jgi:hypothetical protein
VLMWVKCLENRVFMDEHPLRQFTWFCNVMTFSNFKKSK